LDVYEYIVSETNCKHSKADILASSPEIGDKLQPLFNRPIFSGISPG